MDTIQLNDNENVIWTKSKSFWLLSAHVKVVQRVLLVNFPTPYAHAGHTIENPKYFVNLFLDTKTRDTVEGIHNKVNIILFI